MKSVAQDRPQSGSLLDFLKGMLFPEQTPPADLVEFTRSRKAMTRSAKRLKKALEKEDALSGMVRRMKRNGNGS